MRSAKCFTQVTLTRRGPFVKVDPATELLGHLRAGRTDAVGESQQGLKDQALFAVHCSQTGKLQAQVWAGLETVIRGLLRSAGTSFTTLGEWQRTALLPRYSEALTDPSVVSFVPEAERGLVRYDDQTVDVLWLIVQICLAFHTAKVVVIVRTKRDAVDLSHLLVRHGISPAMTGGGKVIDTRHRVVVALLAQMGCVELNKADVVLVADSLFATLEDPLIAAPVPDPNDPTVKPVRKATGLMERLADAGNAAVIGFSPRSRPRSPFETARSWQLYGRRELVVPHHGAVERHVVVGSVGGSIDETIKNTVPYVKNKIRMSHTRNRRVARLAYALHAGEAQEVHRLLPSPLPANFEGVPQHVLVLVESLKQAHAVGKYLPNWPIVSGSGDDERVIKDDGISATRGVIATALGVEELKGDEFDVVVRGDPGCGMPPLPPGWLATAQFPATDLLLVDVHDTGHHLAALWARKRRRAYRAAGWDFLGEDAEVTAWKQFRALVLERRERP